MNRRRIVAIVAKELQIIRSYPTELIGRTVGVWYFAASFYFIGEFLGTAEPVRDSPGGYFVFALIGTIVTSFAMVGLTSFPDLVSEEQEDGTLEAVLATPTPMWTLVVASFIVPTLFVVAETVVLVAVGLLVLGPVIPLAGILQAIPVLLLTALAFAPLGLLSAASVILAKRGDGIGGPARQLTMLTSGALFPISVLPDWAEPFAYLIPATYGVRATRTLATDDGSWGDAALDVVVLGAIALVFMPIGIAVFLRSVQTARRTGVLATY